MEFSSSRLNFPILIKVSSLRSWSTELQGEVIHVIIKLGARVFIYPSKVLGSFIYCFPDDLEPSLLNKEGTEYCAETGILGFVVFKRVALITEGVDQKQNKVAMVPILCKLQKGCSF